MAPAYNACSEPGALRFHIQGCVKDVEAAEREVSMFSSLDEEILKQEEATPAEHREHVRQRIEFYVVISALTLILFVALYAVVRFV